MYTGVHHVVVVVNSLKQAVEDYEKLGFKAERVGVEAAGGIRTAFLYLGDGGSYLELVEPVSQDTPVAHTLQRRGEGIHLVALEVADMRQAVAEMKSRGVQLIEGADVSFIRPKDTHGILYQLMERK